MIQRRKVIACATVIEELVSFLPSDLPYQILDFGLHLHPQNLKKVLQEKIDQASQDTDVLLLGYGLCSMAVVGLVSQTATLVIPRTDDCIGIFLGSCNAYQEQVRKEPGTYYLTKGWIEVGDSPFQNHPHLVAKYGEERAMRMMKLMLKNYTRLAFINTGHFNLQQYREFSRQTADKFGLRYEEIVGSPSLVKKMIEGNWDDEFVVVPPGQAVRYEDFVNPGIACKAISHPEEMI